jgi:hypothetical protein
MKKIMLLTCILTGLSLFAIAQKVNDKIQIEHNGSWYDGTILKVNAAEGQYFVSYDGWSDSWNEWVGNDRIKLGKSTPPVSTNPSGKFAVGDRVEVEYGMVPEPARIISIGENKYEIEYENKMFGKKWVTEKQMKKF